MADGLGRWSGISADGFAKQHNGNGFDTYSNGHPVTSGCDGQRQHQQHLPSRRRSSRSSDQPIADEYLAKSGQYKRRREDYTVGWICALPVPELTASRVLLDEEHDDLALDTRHQYVYGSMHGHNIVLGCLPRTQTGKGAAASVASEMASTFPSLRFGLLVGVAGGAPSAAHDIRLGDVVVSEPDRDKRCGGVVQYDYGKLVQNQGFILNGILQQPPEIILSALGKVQSTPMSSKNSKFLTYLEEFNNEEYPGSPTRESLVDRLFVPDCLHVEGAKDCNRCAEGYVGYHCSRPGGAISMRRERRYPQTRVHYGLIASGDELVRDAQKRDEIASEHGVLCFEMEAAGLMNVFPSGGCLVIRGICDYCDTHKNKDWQPYAAAAAAAWAKEYLRNIPAKEVKSGDTIGKLAQSSPTQTFQNFSAPAPLPMSSGKSEEAPRSDFRQTYTEPYSERSTYSYERIRPHIIRERRAEPEYERMEEPTRGYNPVIVGRNDSTIRRRRDSRSTGTRFDDFADYSGTDVDSRWPRRRTDLPIRTVKDSAEGPESGLEPRARGRRPPSPEPSYYAQSIGRRQRSYGNFETTNIPMEYSRSATTAPCIDHRPPSPTRRRYEDGHFDNRTNGYREEKSNTRRAVSRDEEFRSDSTPLDHERPDGSGRAARRFSDPNDIFREFMRGGGASMGCGGDVNDIFGNFGDHGGGGVRSQSSPFMGKHEPEPDHTIVEKPLPISLEELYNGCTKKLKVQRKTYDQQTGKQNTEDKILSVPIKKGLKARSKIKYPGLGDEDEGSVQDLHFIIQEKPHPLFTRDGDDLRTTIKLDLQEALTGWKRTMQTIDGTYIIVQKGGVTQPGFEQIVPQRGMPNSKTGERGILIVGVQITFPENLTADQKKQFHSVMAPV